MQPINMLFEETSSLRLLIYLVSSIGPLTASSAEESPDDSHPQMLLASWSKARSPCVLYYG